MIPKVRLTSENAKEKSEEKALSSSLNSKDVSKNRRLTQEPNKNFSIPAPSQVHQGSHKEMVCYDVISHLKKIPSHLSVYDAL